MISLSVIALVVITLIFLVELEKFGWSTVLMIASIAAAQLFNMVDLWGWIKLNYLSSIVSVVVYASLGVAWSFVKWIFFLYKFKDKREEAIINATNKNALKQDYAELIGDKCFDNKGSDKPLWMLSLRKKKYKNTILCDTPKAADYKGTIVAWMSWWPVSMVGTLLNDPVRKFLNFTYTRLSGFYQKIANKIVPGINHD